MTPRQAAHDASVQIVEGWVERFSDPLYQFAMSLTRHPETAEEIVQEVFARAWKTYQRRPTQALSGGWFYTVARHLCMDTFRRAAVDHAVRTRLGSGTMEHPADAGSPEQLEALVVRRTLQRLSRTDQRCLWLFYFGDWPLGDIAVELGLSVDGVKSRLARARKRFKQVWREEHA